MTARKYRRIRMFDELFEISERYEISAKYINVHAYIESVELVLMDICRNITYDLPIPDEYIERISRILLLEIDSLMHYLPVIKNDVSIWLDHYFS